MTVLDRKCRDRDRVTVVEEILPALAQGDFIEIKIFYVISTFTYKYFITYKRMNIQGNMIDLTF